MSLIQTGTHGDRYEFGSERVFGGWTNEFNGGTFGGPVWCPVARRGKTECMTIFYGTPNE